MNKEINIYSEEYQSLSNESKLKIVKKMLNELFSSKSRKTITVVHKGKKKQIAKDKAGLYKNLCEREKKLEKVARTFPDDLGSENKEPNTEEKIKQAIKAVEEKIQNILNMYKDAKYTEENPLVLARYRDKYVIVPISVRSTINKLNDMLVKLEKYLEVIHEKEKTYETEVKKNDVAKTNVEYSYMTEDENPYETGYSIFTTVKEPVRKENNTVLPPESNMPKTNVDSSKTKEENDIKSGEKISKKVGKTVQKIIRKNKIKQNIKEKTSKIASKLKGITILSFFTFIENTLKKTYNFSKDKLINFKNKIIKIKKEHIGNPSSKKNNNANVVNKKVTKNISKVVRNIIEKKKTNSNSTTKVNDNDSSNNLGSKAILTFFTFIEKGVKKIYYFGKEQVTKIKIKYNEIKNRKHINKQKENNVTTNENRKKKQRFAAAFCATLLAVTLIPSCRNNRKIDKDSNNSTKPTTSQGNTIDETTPITDPTIGKEETTDPTINSNTGKEEITDPTTPGKVEDDEKIENNEEKVEESSTLSFDDFVTINDNSFIYRNCYDATNNTNALNPYYDGEYERDVQGIVYQLDGKIYIIYETDINAVEKQKSLEEAGATMTAVLVTRSDMTNTGEYEGYYNIDSVKVKKLEK